MPEETPEVPQVELRQEAEPVEPVAEDDAAEAQEGEAFDPFQSQADFAQDISEVLGKHAQSVPLIAMSKILFGVAVDLIVRQSAMQTNYTVAQYITQQQQDDEASKSKIIRLA